MKRNQVRACAMGAAAAFALAIALNNGAGVRDASAQVSSNPSTTNSTTDQPNQNQATQPGRVQTTTEPNAINRPSDRSLHELKTWKASELTGMNVRGRTGDSNIGSIKDLVIANDGQVVYAAVSFGGFLGIGDKLFAVPFEAIEFVKTGDRDAYARIDVNEDTLKNRQGFDKDHWPREADKSFIQGETQHHVERPTTGTTNVPR